MKALFVLLMVVLLCGSLPKSLDESILGEYSLPDRTLAVKIYNTQGALWLPYGSCYFNRPIRGGVNNTIMGGECIKNENFLIVTMEAVDETDFQDLNVPRFSKINVRIDGDQLILPSGIRLRKVAKN